MSPLARDLFLVTTGLPRGTEPVAAVADVKGRATEVEARFLSLTDELLLFTVRLDEPSGSLSIRTAASTHELGDVTDALTSVEVHARERLAAFAPEVRERICGFAARAGDEHGGERDRLAVSRRLALLHTLLRERLPASQTGSGLPHALAPEVLLALDDRSFYVRGWFAAREAPPVRLTAVSPEGGRMELLPTLARIPRFDVSAIYGDTEEEELVRRCGFVAAFELDAPSRLDEGWFLELEDASGDAVEAAPLSVVRDPGSVRDMILADVGREPPYEDAIVAGHAHPALEKLQERHRAGIELADLHQYGLPVEAPDVSIVIPLYRRADLVQHQLAQFACDPELQQVDLIYVLDSPELARQLDHDAKELHELYRVPFRVAVLRRNAGLSGAYNVGASVGRGRLLLLLDADVLPARPGWLGTMTLFYESTPRIGALGPKLLYEDDTVQHAGIDYRRDPITRLWRNEHRFKGVHGSLPAVNLAQPVRAVTSACLLIHAELYRQLGGLSQQYVQGGFEDSDLCLRLLAEGLDTWYLPDVELYHLEGQSYGADARELSAKYNAWLHTQLWDERITELATRGLPVSALTVQPPDELREVVVG